MRGSRRATALVLTGVVSVSFYTAALAQDAPASARTWLGQEEQIEAYIKSAEVIEIQDIGTGVTNPKRADLAPGGPIDRISFKPLRPGIYRGYWESYKAEIAAYELDKLLGLGLIPPTVEKRIDGDLGAAAMWVAPTQSFGDLDGPPTPPSRQMARWNYQLIRAKMFHNLIYNKDPNLGNWLVDPAWNLMIIDNSRAFTRDRRMVHKLTRVEQALWDRMLALDEPTLSAALGEWLGDREIRAILERRDDMVEDVQEIADARGETRVFVTYKPLPSPQPRQARQDIAGAVIALRGQLVDALSEVPIVLPASELSYLGQVVRLADYDGPGREVARVGVSAGHTWGLMTETDGLVCLAPDRHDGTAHDAIVGFLGRRAEVFGIAEDVDGMTILQVMASRSAP